MLVLALLVMLQSYTETIQQGIAARDSGQLGDAERAFREAIELSPEDAQAKLLLANLLLDTDQAEQALEIIEPMVLSLPEVDRSPIINTLFGLALAQSGRHEDALAPLRAALEIQPRRTKALFNLGRSLQALERFEEAAEVYTRGLALPTPENIRFAIGLARCQIRLARIDDARAHLDDFVSRHPRVGRGWLLRGIVAFEEGDYKASIGHIEKAVELGYDLAESDLRLGMAFGMLHEYEPAQLHLDQALAKEPELATAYYYKGLFLFSEGEELSPGGGNPFGVHAIRLLERSLELSPNPKASLALAEAQLRLRLNSQVVATATEASQTPELAANAYHLMALAHHELLEYEPAEQAYQAALEAGGDTAVLFHDWGNLLAVMGRWEEAKQKLTLALDKDPELIGSLLQLGVVHLNLREHDTALAYLERVVAKAPENAEAWYQKGVIESRQGDPENAVASWRRALALDPEQSRLYYRLGAELVKLGRVDERNALLSEFQARERTTELAAQRSEQLSNLLAGAVAASSAGDDERALALLNEAKAAAVDDPLPFVYLGDFFLSRDRLDDATQVLLEGLGQLPDALAIYQTLLSVYTAKGDTGAANSTRIKIKSLLTRSD